MSQDAAFHIELPEFEGPLDLLLHLIRKHELDIMDLPISFVAERYLHYLALMRQLDLDVASEYLLMAATLAYIKSRTLLPAAFPDQEEEDDEVQEDPRAELIRQLLEYQKYKAVADELGSRSVMGRDVFGRGAPPPAAEGPAPLAEIGLFKLMDAFEGILKRLQGRLSFEVSAERITVSERISQVTEIVRAKQFCRFDELFEGVRTRYDLIVTFLAILEMARMRIARVYQADHTSPIYLQFALLDADAPTVPPPSGSA
jgi:segregation and condensation protein A